MLAGGEQPSAAAAESPSSRNSSRETSRYQATGVSALSRRRGASFDLKLRVAVAAERDDRGQRRLRHAGQRARAFEQGVVERAALRVGLVDGRWRQDEAGQHVVRVEAEVGALQREERLSQQRAADEQHERERHLRDDQHATRAAAAVAHLAAAALA